MPGWIPGLMATASVSAAYRSTQLRSLQVPNDMHYSRLGWDQHGGKVGSHHGPHGTRPCQSVRVEQCAIWRGWGAEGEACVCCSGS
ncbi:hypothetical protein F4808DRAFT_413283 [Astrocystis sublimbata]|nr:hypothetical protein F4808DRAFT_413283 [Astrocystis sublimbata]